MTEITIPNPKLILMKLYTQYLSNLLAFHLQKHVVQKRKEKKNNQKMKKSPRLSHFVLIHLLFCEHKKKRLVQQPVCKQDIEKDHPFKYCIDVV